MFDKNFTFKKTLRKLWRPFFHIDLKYLAKIGEKPKYFPLHPKGKCSPQKNFSNYMIDSKPKPSTLSENLNCEWQGKFFGTFQNAKVLRETWYDYWENTEGKFL